MSNTPETDQEEIVMGRTECDRYVLAEFARRLERERDEAKRLLDKKSKYLAQAITQRDHAETELRKLIDFSKSVLVERDEARGEAAHWKTEYEIVEARLCGWKHPRDNGIISEHEVIPRLEKKIVQLEGKTAKPEPLWYNQREIPIDREEETK
jgi:hypothetical protein